MNSGPAHWALTHLNTWTWFVAEYRTWLIVLATVAGLAAPFLARPGNAGRAQRLPWSSAAPPWRWRFPPPR